MGRHKKQRNIGENPDCLYFKPANTGELNSHEIELKMDEFQAIKRADVENLSMKISAEKMGISAPTFCRILRSARKKIGSAIVAGYAIKICPCGQR